MPPPTNLRSSQKVLGPIWWNFAQLLKPHTRPGAQPSLSLVSQSVKKVGFGLYASLSTNVLSIPFLAHEPASPMPHALVKQYRGSYFAHCLWLVQKKPGGQSLSMTHTSVDRGGKTCMCWYVRVCFECSHHASARHTLARAPAPFESKEFKNAARQLTPWVSSCLSEIFWIWISVFWLAFKIILSFDWLWFNNLSTSYKHPFCVNVLLWLADKNNF